MTNRKKDKKRLEKQELQRAKGNRLEVAVKHLSTDRNGNEVKR